MSEICSLVLPEYPDISGSHCSLNSRAYPIYHALQIKTVICENNFPFTRSVRILAVTSIYTLINSLIFVRICESLLKNIRLKKIFFQFNE